MTTANRSSGFDAQMLENARSYGNRIVAEAIDQHGILPVLCPFKRHRSAQTGNEFAMGNQAVLQAAALTRGYQATEWATPRLVTENGGRIKGGENGVRIISVHQAFIEEDKLDADKKPIVNPETGEIEKVRKYEGPKAFYPLTVYNLDQTEGFTPKRSSLTPDAPTLPVAVSSVWSAVRMPLPNVKSGGALRYDIGTDEMEVPPLEAFKGNRASTNAAYQLATHLAFATGHSKRLAIPDFYDAGRYEANHAMVDVATNVAGAFLLTNHCQKFDPATVDGTGIAEAKNVSQQLRSREIELHLAMAQAHDIYRYMVTPGAVGRRAGTKP